VKNDVNSKILNLRQVDIQLNWSNIWDLLKSW